MIDKVNYLTKDGAKKLHDELEYLIRTRRKEVANRIQEAKELGDLSENAEYQEAKDEQAFNEGRIEEIENTLRSAVIIDEGLAKKGQHVQVGSTIEVKANGKNSTFVLVGSNESDPLHGRISNESPLGQALLGKTIGEAVSAKTPRGEVAYEIIKIS